MIDDWLQGCRDEGLGERREEKMERLTYYMGLASDGIAREVGIR